MRKMVVLPGLMLLVLFAVGVACAGATPTPTPRPTATPTAVTAQATPTPTPTSTPVPKGFLGPGPKVELNHVTGDSASNPQWKDVDSPYTEKIMPERSGGRVTFKAAAMDQVGLTGFELVRLLREGGYDVAQATLLYVGGDVPLAEGADLPGLYANHDIALKGTTAFGPELDRAISALNLKLISKIFPSAGSQIMYCRFPVTGLADLKGKRVRVFGTPLGDFFGALAATSITISFPEVYAALERGVADCAITGSLSGNTQRWYEVTTHLYPLSFGLSLKFYAMNKDVYNKVPAAVQDFLVYNYNEMADKMWDVLRLSDTVGVACSTGDSAKCDQNIGKLAAASNSMKLVPVTDADRLTLKDVLQSTVLPKWVARCGGAKCSDAFNRSVGGVLGLEAKAK